MATIGLRYLIAARYNEDETSGTVTYTDARVLGHAIRAAFNIPANETPLYADDRKVETLREFTGGTVEIVTDDLHIEARAFLFGHTMKEVTDDNGTYTELVSGADDQAPYLGQGFFAPSVRNGKRLYRAVWLRKVQYGVPNEELATKGENVTWQTPTVTGSLMADSDSRWKEEALFDDAEAAKQWLNGKAGGIAVSG